MQILKKQVKSQAQGMVFAILNTFGSAALS